MPQSQKSKGKSSSSRQQHGWTEADMAEALEHLLTQEKPNVLETARLFKIPEATLRGRFTGKNQAPSVAHEHEQAILPLDKFILAEWVCWEADQGTPITKPFILDRAFDITGRRLHGGWIDRFLKRNPDILLGKVSSLDPKRAQAFNRTIVANHFKALRQLIIDEDIPLEHLWNMDEKGIQQGGGRGMWARKFFVPRGRRPRYRLHSASLELTTIVEAVNAAGQSILPGFIFQGKELLPEWLDVNPNISIATSTNGWTDDFLGYEWFEKVFIPEANKLRVNDKPIVLIFDGHGSHVTMQMRRLAIANNIHLYLLPAHTTHHLQPLDKGCFGPLQRAWQDACARVLRDTGRELQRCDVVRVYMEAREKAFTEHTIREAWRKSGISPFNPDIFTDKDYAPSLSFSILPHAPPSYPTHNPYHPENGLNDADYEIMDSLARARDVDPDVALREHLALDRPRGQQSTSGVDGCLAGEGEQSASLPPRPPMSLPERARVHGAYRAHPYKTREELSARVDELDSEVTELKERLYVSQAQNKHMLMHATVWKNRALAVDDKKKKKGGRRNVVVGGGFITSREAMEQGEADEAARQADESRKQAARDKKLADEEARRLQRLQNAGTVKFSGSLASKNVPDLQDVAYELGLPIKNGTKDLTKAQLVESIITTLNRMELDLRRNERFAGLYSSLDRTRKRATGDEGGGAPDENAPPPQASSSTQPVPPPPRTPSPSNAGLFTFSPPHTPHPLSNTYSPRSNRIYTTQSMAPMYQPDFHNFFPQPPFDQSSMHHSSHWPQHPQYPYFPPYPPYPQFPNG